MPSHRCIVQSLGKKERLYSPDPRAPRRHGSLLVRKQKRQANRRLVSRSGVFFRDQNRPIYHDINALLGGGYCLPADPAHLSFAAEIADVAGKTVAVLLPSIELAPYAQYPHQLIQGVEIIRHLVTELKYEPSDIIMAGDSAGELNL